MDFNKFSDIMEDFFNKEISVLFDVHKGELDLVNLNLNRYAFGLEIGDFDSDISFNLKRTNLKEAILKTLSNQESNKVYRIEKNQFNHSDRNGFFFQINILLIVS
jgi:hypothetical protein